MELNRLPPKPLWYCSQLLLSTTPILFIPHVAEPSIIRCI